LTEVYIELLEKKEPLLDLQQTQATIAEINSAHVINENREKLIVTISEEEKQLHKKFLETQVPKSFMLK
jgi:hypothetical protein